MDSAREHDFGFNEAFSLMVGCEAQDEMKKFDIAELRRAYGGVEAGIGGN